MQYDDERTVTSPNFASQNKVYQAAQRDFLRAEATAGINQVQYQPLAPVQPLPSTSNLVVAGTKSLFALLSGVLLILLIGVWVVAGRLSQLPTNNTALAENQPQATPGKKKPSPGKPTVIPGAKPTRRESNEHIAQVDTINLNLRETPGRQTPIITILPIGTEVVMLKEKELVDGQLWNKVRLGEAVGWVNRKYLMPK